MVRCACDCCPVVRARGDAWTEDGYCARCAAWCYPAIEVDGVLTRAQVPLEDRRARHGVAEPAPPPPPLPQVLPLLAHQVAQAGFAALRSEAHRRNVVVVLQAAETLGPMLPGIGQLAGAIRRFLR